MLHKRCTPDGMVHVTLWYVSHLSGVIVQTWQTKPMHFYLELAIYFMQFTTVTGIIRDFLQTGLPHQNVNIFKNRVLFCKLSCPIFLWQLGCPKATSVSVKGTCDLEPVQNMLIYRIKSSALLMLAASPG